MPALRVPCCCCLPTWSLVLQHWRNACPRPTAAHHELTLIKSSAFLCARRSYASFLSRWVGVHLQALSQHVGKLLLIEEYGRGYQVQGPASWANLTAAQNATIISAAFAEAAAQRNK